MCITIIYCRNDFIYFIFFAACLCEGRFAGFAKLWADAGLDVSVRGGRHSYPRLQWLCEHARITFVSRLNKWQHVLQLSVCPVSRLYSLWVQYETGVPYCISLGDHTKNENNVKPSSYLWTALSTQCVRMCMYV